MSRARWLTYHDRQWGLTELAREHHLAVGTLAARIDRFGETATGITRALATGIVSRETSGRRGKQNSPWKAALYPNRNGAT